MTITIITLSVLLIISVFFWIRTAGRLEEILDINEENYRYTDALEEVLMKTFERVGETYETMKKIDIKGSFESDDEVGVTFTQMKETIEELNTFIEQHSTENNEDDNNG